MTPQTVTPKARFAMSPVGKRMIRCKCTEEYDPLDDNIECFEEGPASAQCSVCHTYPWYHIKPATGGSNRRLHRPPGFTNRGPNSEQARNRSNNVKLVHDGEKHTVAEWARLTGINQATIYKRTREGWPASRALTEPADTRKSHAPHTSAGVFAGLTHSGPRKEPRNA